MGIGGLGIQMRRGGRENRGGWKDLCTYQTSKQDHPAAAAKAIPILFNAVEILKKSIKHQKLLFCAIRAFLNGPEGHLESKIGTQDFLGDVHGVSLG